LIVEKNELQDTGGIIMGFRAAAADIAWVQLIQYCGGETLPDESRTLDLLKNFTLRVVRIDPYFYEAYLFSSGILAWFKNVNRPDEAIEILQEGIKNNPKHWPFRIHLAAIVYKKAEEYGKMASSLEEAIRYPECPSIIKAILANYYKEQKEYARAVTVWESVLASDDSAYQNRAEEQISILEELLENKNRIKK
jgi:tetratricopeptide (TPR) repeat protein